MKTKPRLTRRIIVRLDGECAASVERICARHRLSASDLIRAAVCEKIGEWLCSGPIRKPRGARREAAA